MNDVLTEPCELIDADLDLVAGGANLGLINQIQQGVEQLRHLPPQQKQLVTDIAEGTIALTEVAEFISHL